MKPLFSALAATLCSGALAASDSPANPTSAASTNSSAMAPSAATHGGPNSAAALATEGSPNNAAAAAVRASGQSPLGSPASPAPAMDIAASRMTSRGTTTRSAANSVPAAVATMRPPPAPISEPRPSSPGANYTWVPGNNIWRDNQWPWVSVQWTVPPHRGATWIPSSYDPRTAQWTPGHWREPAREPSPATTP